jgi:hypothetical protein
MNREEMIAILAKSSGGHRSETEIEALLDTSIVNAESLERPDPEDETTCICGDLFDDGGEHYTHMSGGY